MYLTSGGASPGVYRHQDASGQGHGKLGDEHLWDVGHQVRHPVAEVDTTGPQRVRDPGDLFGQLGVRHPSLAVDHSFPLWEHFCGTTEERQRGQGRGPDIVAHCVRGHRSSRAGRQGG